MGSLLEKGSVSTGNWIDQNQLSVNPPVGQKFKGLLKLVHVVGLMDHGPDLALVIEGIETLLGLTDEGWIVHHVISPEESDHGNVLEQDAVGGNFRNRSSCEPDHQQTTFPGDALGTQFENLSSDGIVNHIRSPSSGPFLHRSDKIILFIVHDFVRPALSADLEFFFGSCSGKNSGTEGFPDLYRGGADSSGTTVDEQGFPGFQSRTVD